MRADLLDRGWIIIKRSLAVMVAALAVSSAASAATSRTDGSIPASSRIFRLVTSVPARTLDKVGSGKLSGPETSKLKGAPLSSGGKPEVLTYNLAWCPHCAANSWALAVALSRFGTFGGLRTIDTGTWFGTHVGANPSFPHTKGISFFHVAYSSQFLTFAAIVREDLAGHVLQRPNPQQRRALRIFDPFDTSPALDVGGVWGFLSSGYSPAALAHKSALQIASTLADPADPLARRIDGLANVFTAAMCDTTHQSPRSVCTSRGVRAARRARL